MSTIRILSKKAFRFKNPDRSILEGDRHDHTINDTITKQPKFEDLYFDTHPGVIEDAPAWIKADKMWGWAVKDGDLMEIKVESQVANADPKTAAKVAAAQQHAGTTSANNTVTGLAADPGDDNADAGGTGAVGGVGGDTGPIAPQTGGTPEPPADASAPSGPPKADKAKEAAPAKGKGGK